MSAASRHADGLGKRYGSKWALRDCTLEIPAGSVTALVGPNGAGKTTLLQLAVGLTRPTRRRASRVLGLVAARRRSATLLPRRRVRRAGAPALHAASRSREMLEARPRAQPELGRRRSRSQRIERLGLPLEQKVGKLSGGQQAQVALTLALAKRPELLLLDEPVASLDPLARREFLQTVMEAVAETAMTVVLSSHIVADLERVCDHLVILSDGAHAARRADRRDRREPPPAHRPARRRGGRRPRARRDPREPHRAPDDAARARQRARLRRALGAARGRPRGDRARLPRLRRRLRSSSRERWRHDLGRLAPAAHRDADRGRRSSRSLAALLVPIGIDMARVVSRTTGSRRCLGALVRARVCGRRARRRSSSASTGSAPASAGSTSCPA